MGNGVKDNTDQVPLAFDGNQQTFWSTFVYKQQFPSALKPGVGLTLVFANPITPTRCTVSSDTPDTTIEIRSARRSGPAVRADHCAGPGAHRRRLECRPGSVKITLTNAPKSKYLVVFIVHMAADGDGFKSDINEISVSGNLIATAWRAPDQRGNDDR